VEEGEKEEEKKKRSIEEEGAFCTSPPCFPYFETVSLFKKARRIIIEPGRT